MAVENPRTDTNSVTNFFFNLKVIYVHALIKNSHNKLPEDDQERSKHVGVMTNYLLKYNLNISAFIGYIV